MSYLESAKASPLKFGSKEIPDHWAASLSSISILNWIFPDFAISTLENVNAVPDFLASNSSPSTNILRAVTNLAQEPLALTVNPSLLIGSVTLTLPSATTRFSAHWEASSLPNLLLDNLIFPPLNTWRIALSFVKAVPLTVNLAPVFFSVALISLVLFK